MSRNEWKVSSSVSAKNTSNPIRAIVDTMKVQPHPDKQMISLSIGDPTIFGNFKCPQNLVDTLAKNANQYKANGYPPAHGYDYARAALAEYYTRPEAPLTKDDVLIASGCSGAIELVISGIANPGDNIIIPKPGFSLYQTICDAKGINTKYYNLIPERSWEADLEMIEKLIDEKTVGILVNNPSNPCGSVYSEAHLKDILNLAEKHKVLIIADEIYADMSFGEEKFHPMASLTSTVPVISTGGTAKRWMVPGWRVGWIFVHDRNGILKEVKEGLIKLSQLVLGANSLIQSCLPDLLQNTPQEYYDGNLKKLKEHAMFTCEKISEIKGLKPVVPKGAMYVMVSIDIDQFKDIKDDADFCEKLVCEESVFCLPGQCFKYPNFFRIVFTPPIEHLDTAYKRIADFCQRHRK